MAKPTLLKNPNEKSALDRWRPDRSRLRLTSSASPTIQLKRSQLKNKLEFNGQVRMGRHLSSIAHQKARDP
jgi:hypothetical protein